MTGLKLSTGRPHIVRAVLEGIAAQIAELSDLTLGELGHGLTRLRVDGGLTNSKVLMQAQADLLQTPIDTYPSAHATALGTAAAMRLALNEDLSLAEAPFAWEPAATYEPEWSREDALRFRSQWRAAVEANLGASA